MNSFQALTKVNMAGVAKPGAVKAKQLRPFKHDGRTLKSDCNSNRNSSQSSKISTDSNRNWTEEDDQNYESLRRSVNAGKQQWDEFEVVDPAPWNSLRFDLKFKSLFQMT